MSDISNQVQELRDILAKVWSIQSSTKWTPLNPALGQCPVTSLVVNDLFGGEILKTDTPEGWHFYNCIDGRRHDFTDCQFSVPLDYKDVLSSREEAFSDTNAEQYSYLKEIVRKYLTPGS